MDKVIFVGKKFTLGVCNCGCKKIISVITRNWKARLQKYTKGHYPINSRQLKGSNANHWKGGRTVHSSGYIWIRRNNGYVLEHRLVWEEEYNAMLLPWSDVHHIDGNKKNNVWYNLKAMMKDDHTKHHRREKDFNILSEK